jgi:hypothetical protein
MKYEGEDSSSWLALEFGLLILLPPFLRGMVWQTKVFKKIFHHL